MNPTETGYTCYTTLFPHSFQAIIDLYDLKENRPDIDVNGCLKSGSTRLQDFVTRGFKLVKVMRETGRGTQLHINIHIYSCRCNYWSIYTFTCVQYVYPACTHSD